MRYSLVLSLLKEKEDLIKTKARISVHIHTSLATMNEDKKSDIFMNVTLDVILAKKIKKNSTFSVSERQSE